MKKVYIIQLLLVLFTCILNAQNPTYLLELRNDVQTSGTVYEFDIYLLRTGSIEFEYASGQFGIVLNPQILNGGAVMASVVPGSSNPILETSVQNPTSITFSEGSSAIKIAGRASPGAGKGALISNVPPGTRLCRVRLSNTVYFGQYQADLTWTTTLIHPTQISAYVGGTNTLITNHSNHTTTNLVNQVLNVVTSNDDYSRNDFEFRVYPNPFSERITINYKLLQNTHVRLSVLDTNGRQVEQLADENQQEGIYSYKWIPVSHPAGVYIVKLQTGMNQKISRITFID